MQPLLIHQTIRPKLHRLDQGSLPPVCVSQPDFDVRIPPLQARDDLSSSLYTLCKQMITAE